MSMTKRAASPLRTHRALCHGHAKDLLVYDGGVVGAVARHLDACEDDADACDAKTDGCDPVPGESDVDADDDRGDDEEKQADEDGGKEGFHDGLREINHG